MMKHNLDIDLQVEMCELLNQSEYEVLIQRCSKKIRCSCYNEKYSEPDSKCPRCIGTGWLFKFTRVKTLRQRASSSTSGFQYTEAGPIHDDTMMFYLSHDTFVDVKDYIWEVAYKDNKPVKLLCLYQVTHVDKQRGMTGRIEYKIASCKKESIDKDFKGTYIGKAWRDL